MPNRKHERLEVRITRAQKHLIERAAQLRGTSLTAFVLASTQQAAAATVGDYRTLTLRDEAGEVFAKALLNPPVPNKAASAAARRYKSRVGS
jgi:uncharacterized protein (DUF1778 family)